MWILRMPGRGWRRRMWGEGNGRRIVEVVAGETVPALHTPEKPWLSFRNRTLKNECNGKVVKLSLLIESPYKQGSPHASKLVFPAVPSPTLMRLLTTSSCKSQGLISSHYSI